MSGKDKIRAQETTALIKEFEEDVIFGTFGLVMNFVYYNARRELLKRGEEALVEIVEHLHNNAPSSKFGFDLAWSELLREMQSGLAPEKTGPKSRDNIQDLMYWADDFVSK